MEIILASLAIIFALIALVVGIVAVRSMKRVSGQLKALDKKLVSLNTTLDAQERKMAALEQQARAAQSTNAAGLAPIALALANMKKKGVAPTLAMIGFHLLSGAVQKRKALAARNNKITIHQEDKNE